MTTKSLTIQGTALRWKRNYVPNTRTVIDSVIDMPSGTYRMVRNRACNYTVSYAPKGGEEFDLAGCQSRTECDDRVRKHLSSGG